jgi:hypothetical protein
MAENIKTWIRMAAENKKYDDDTDLGNIVSSTWRDGTSDLRGVCFDENKVTVVDFNKILSDFKLVGVNQIFHNQDGNGWFVHEYNEFTIKHEGENVDISVCFTYDTYDDSYECTISYGHTWTK